MPWPLIYESNSERDEDGSQEGSGAIAIIKNLSLSLFAP